MTSAVQNPADLVNLSLARLGSKMRIGDLYEGSNIAKKALDVFAQTRDQLMRAADPNFCERIIQAVPILGQPPAPWSFWFYYPGDCLRLRNMFTADYLANKNNPLPVLYTVADDILNKKVILTNNASPTLVYTSQVTDPTRWDPLFVESFAAALARRLAPSVSSADAAKMEAEDEKAMAQIAVGTVE